MILNPDHYDEPKLKSTGGLKGAWNSVRVAVCSGSFPIESGEVFQCCHQTLVPCFRKLFGKRVFFRQTELMREIQTSGFIDQQIDGGAHSQIASDGGVH